MARLACCLVLISLCLCVVLEPALAAKKGGHHKVKSAKHIAHFPSPVPTVEHALIQQLCQDTRRPKLCRKIVRGKDVNVSPVVEAKVGIDIATSMASRVGAYISNQLKTNRVKALLTRGSVEVCKLNYDNAIADLNLSYNNFDNNPKVAVESLNRAVIKVGLCRKSLNLGGKHAEIPPVHEANKVIQTLIHAAQSVLTKEQEH
ncbi:hypothetical protein RIF29_18560 [Crotalaria pallida]|uniref:Pectinesterase inhibitor domain-containing protein n=1 Tax=Crotalaria pallida TaxID=3830 RepID=A0AAN9FQZ6_CROPI